MDNTITGRVIAVMDERSGISKSGAAWRERTYVVETEERYPKRCAFSLNGDNIAKFNIQQGDVVTAHLDFNAHQWQGKWYNEVVAWKIDRS